MNPLRKLAILLVVLAVGLSACGGDEDLARVGDSVIRRSDIDRLFDGGAPSDDVFRDMLFSRVALEALTLALTEQYGVTADYAAAEQQAQQLEDYLAQAGYTLGEYLGVENASRDLLLMHSQVWAVQKAALDRRLLEPAVVDELFADPDSLTEVCAKHILVATAEEAEAVMDRLAAGEDFAAVAGEVSLDTNTEGGDLGCARAGTYVAEFADAAINAPIGELTGPVESEFGFHVLIVSARTPLTREEYLADPWAALGDTQLSRVWAAWMQEVLEQAEVWVAADVGTWTPTGIEAPGAETTTSSQG